jgi:hypothetical protein
VRSRDVPNSNPILMKRNGQPYLLTTDEIELRELPLFAPEAADVATTSGRSRNSIVLSNKDGDGCRLRTSELL